MSFKIHTDLEDLSSRFKQWCLQGGHGNMQHAEIMKMIQDSDPLYMAFISVCVKDWTDCTNDIKIISNVFDAENLLQWIEYEEIKP